MITDTAEVKALLSSSYLTMEHSVLLTYDTFYCSTQLRHSVHINWEIFISPTMMMTTMTMATKSQFCVTLLGKGWNVEFCNDTGLLWYARVKMVKDKMLFVQYWHPKLFPETRKPSYCWQTHTTRKHAKNCSNSTCLQRCRWQYWHIFIRLAIAASEICEIARNSLKIQTYGVQGHPRSSILVSIDSPCTTSY